MRIIIAGSRSFQNYQTLKSVCNHYLQNIPNPVIVCGHAKGADQLALQYAKEHLLPVQSFHPNWAKYGKQAAIIRNQYMAQNAQALILFWCGASKGSKNMLQQAKKYQLPVRVFYFNQLFNQLGRPF